jgi:hypothetical protein
MAYYAPSYPRGTLVGYEAAEIRVTFGTMERWTINASCLSVLVCLLLLVVLILVLPQVDLPDTAFHGGTAPVDLHARVTSAPSLLSVGAAIPFSFFAHPASHHSEHSLVLAHASSSFLPLLHRSLRC